VANGQAPNLEEAGCLSNNCYGTIFVAGLEYTLSTSAELNDVATNS
jgi:hypothetical protein